MKSNKIILAFSLVFIAETAFATEFGKMQISASPYIPRIYLSGYGGTNWLGQLDLLAPIFVRDNKNLFLYGQGRLANKEEDSEDNTWVGSFGLGYRQMFGDKQAQTFFSPFILGGYLFADYNNSPIGNNFWTISPGLEAMGNKWDMRINGYFPVGSVKWNDTKYASQMGNYGYTYFTGHEQYDHLFQNTEQAADYGFDAEIGYQIFEVWHTPIKVFLNGYHFSADENINGIGGKITWDPWHYLTLSLNDSYDNAQKNTFTVGLRIKLSVARNYLDQPANDSQLQARLYEPVDRNFGTIGIANTLQSAKTTMDLGPQLETANIWFFAPNNSSAMSSDSKTSQLGTYENPYNSSYLNQITVNQIAQTSGSNPSYLYLAEGTYNTNSNLELHANQNLYGRSEDFTAPATGAARPTIYGALTLDGNNVVDSVNLFNVNQQFADAITVNSGSDNVILNNISVGLTGDDALLNLSETYKTGIYMTNAKVTVNNSTINAYAYGAATPTDNIDAYGVFMLSGGNLNLNNTTIKSSANETGGVKDHNFVGNSFGIAADGLGEHINVANSAIYSYAAGGDSESGNGIGVYIGAGLTGALTTYTVSSNIVNIDQTKILATGDGTDNASGKAYGILFGAYYNLGAGGLVAITIKDNYLTATNSNLEAYGTAHSNPYYSNDNSGNAAAIAIGAEQGDATFDIEYNHITVANSNLLGVGTTLVSPSADSSNGYGIMIGVDEFTLTNLTVANNELTITDHSKIKGEGHTDSGWDDGYGYGIMLGAGIHRDDTSTFKAENNNLAISNGVTITAEAGNSNAYGLFIGCPRIADDPTTYTITNNQIFISADNSSLNNTIEVISKVAKTYGIWIDTGKGNNITVSNTNFASNNNSGAAIHYSDGHEDPWTN
jgi:hypothetical protein